MNPWADLLEPPRTRPGDPLPVMPKAPARRHSADGYTVQAAAAVVVTDIGKADELQVRLMPIVALDFTP